MPEAPAPALPADPAVDTPMVVTLDQLEPCDLNPRTTRNPRYDDIKASIRERKLDSPPLITRRPGAARYMIANGGNTRLSILRELWMETGDQAFYRLNCMFRPWTARADIVVLTGHLSENDLRGGLSFIERALGVEKARELYERESPEGTLTQVELAQRLCADGYPVTQSQISRMQEAVTHLLPAIPTALYGGLGRPQIERLVALRRAAARIYERHKQTSDNTAAFTALFQDAVAPFDGPADGFDWRRVQDELLGQLSIALDADYDALALEIADAQTRHQTLTRAPRPQFSGDASKESVALRVHIVSPAKTTDRLQTIRRMVADASGDAMEDFEANALQARPVQANCVPPVADVWYVEPRLETPDRLRTHIAQLATAIAHDVGIAECIEPAEAGLGYRCIWRQPSVLESEASVTARTTWTLLRSLSDSGSMPTDTPVIDDQMLGHRLGMLLHGFTPLGQHGADKHRLSDTGLIQLFRLIRLARRLIELDVRPAAAQTASTI